MAFYIALQFLILIFSIAIHEFSHGWVAYKLGDPTAKYLGRLTLNPLAHIDLFGTILLPILLTTLRLPPIGWAKPVPIDFSSLRNPKRDILWVGIAGPAANFSIALLLSLVIKLIPQTMQIQFLSHAILYGIIINLVLGIFNLVPIPPLDGSRIVTALLPWRYVGVYNRLQPYGFLIIIALLWSGVLRYILAYIVYTITKLIGIGTPLY